MSNPTTPFGWQMPEPTDLVTDLPADFEVFGQAVATDLQYLLGGTTGQVLAKASGTDLDFDWVTDAAGMTNPMTTTGDVIYSSPGSTPVRLGIGTANQVLRVNSGATAPEWATPATPASGLTLINTTSFSAVSSFAPANGTFSATYDNYRVIISGITTASGTQSFSIRYRANGTNNTTAEYYSQRLTGDVSVASADNTSGGTSFLVSYGGSGGNSSLYMDFSNPFATKYSEILCFANGWITGQGNILKMATLTFGATTSFDSFSLIVGGSTFSGICSVYGYQN